jgi:lipopolysaccharide transport protein LptA
MQKTVKFLRIALPILFVAFIALLFIKFNNARTRRAKPADVAVTSTIRPDEKPRIEARSFDDIQTMAGRVVSKIHAERLVSFSSGWSTLEDVHLTVYRANGLTYELICPLAQFNGTTKESEVKGGVKLTSSDGIEIATAEMHFDGTALASHVPVQFKVDTWAGTAGALDLSVQEETLKLSKKVDATMTPARPGDYPMRLTGEEGTFQRKVNDLTFVQAVTLVRLSDRMTADTMKARFTPDRKSLTAVEGTGHVVMALASNSPIAGSPAGSADMRGAKTIICDRFFSDLGPDGKFSAFNAVGDAAPAHAVIQGPPQRDLTARSFHIALADGKQVTEIRAEPQVVMHELGPLPRELTGDKLVVYFDRATDRANSALIDGNFKYKDAKNSASAVRANYDITNDRVVLTADPGYTPTVVSDGQTLKANVIEFSPRAGTMKANGGVIAQIVSKQNNPTSMDGTQIFPAGKPVFVNSDSVSMKQATKLGVFTGNVRAWQETNTLFAQELQVVGAGEQISARGNVRTVLYNASSDTPRKTPVLSRSDQLAAHKADRRIDLTGNVKIDDDTRTLTGERASFFFDQNRKLERTEAETKVILVERAAGRKGTGDKAVYQMQKRLIFLYGSPATVTDPKGTFSGGQLVFDLARNKVEVVSSTGPTEGTYKP